MVLLIFLPLNLIKIKKKQFTAILKQILKIKLTMLQVIKTQATRTGIIST